MFRFLLRLLPLVSLVIALAGSNWSGYADRIRWGNAPGQFYAALDGSPVFGDRTVLGVAHNAGNGGPATSLAVDHGADIIEIDVVAYEGKLYAAHNAPPGWLPTSAYKGPTLATAWKRASEARFIQLDLKETSASTVRKIVRFLEQRQDGPRVMISARDIDALDQIKTERPEVIAMLSIGDASALERLMDNPDYADLINGVTVRASLLDAETVDWLQDHGMLVIAWTVNDLTTTNDMLALGVDALVTDNLAVLDALGNPPGILNPARWDMYFR